jgi:acetyl-CoA synthetase
MFKDYQKLYQTSIKNPDAFWDKITKELITWSKPWSKVSEGDFTDGDIKWFLGAELNVSVNCLDRHLPKYAHKPALIWQGNEPQDVRTLTYQELFELTNRFANLLKSYDIQKGDRVCLYMPVVPEAVAAMLACTRIGVIHSVVFGGFSAEALKNRIVAADCKAVITVNEGCRGESVLPFKTNVDEALEGINNVHTVFVVKRNDHPCVWREGRDVDVLAELPKQKATCDAVALDSEAPLFILYTSGSTGQPKGVLHTTGGYLTYAAYTCKYIFDLKDDDIYFCTADIGWITGHSYVVYGPLANGATTVIYEGPPAYPTPQRMWEIVDKFKVSIFYTAPTLLRSLMQYGDNDLKKTSRKSLRVLGSVGEPINKEAWQWYFEKIGGERCPIMDTWWQTETGGIMLAPTVALGSQKPGSAMKPFFGIEPAILTSELKKVTDQSEGSLVITKPWPGVMRTVYGDHQRFIDTYLKPAPGYYTSGDSAKCDKDGDYWILGRMDDVLKISGHRLGTAEVESALALDKRVAEAAVVGYPHPIKGEGIYAFVILKAGMKGDETLAKELIAAVRKTIGPIATIDYIQFVTDLPKTRSGKIMRRILRNMVEGEHEDFGDLSTLADPDCIKNLLAGLKIS